MTSATPDSTLKLRLNKIAGARAGEGGIYLCQHLPKFLAFGEKVLLCIFFAFSSFFDSFGIFVQLLLGLRW
jgi:hypothetical protein